MNLLAVAQPGAPEALFPVTRYIGLLIGALMLVQAGPANSVDTGVGLVIENDTDSNGIISVVEGTSVRVTWMVVGDNEAPLNKRDVIELLRAEDDSLVASAVRGKGTSGTVSLKVRKSVGEELYVRYRVKKDDSIQNATPDIADPGRVALMSIAAANLDDLAIRTNALESAAPIYAVGDVGPAGGWVFQVSDGGLHGLEAAPVDQGDVEWGCHGSNLSGAAGTALGTGAKNTGEILTGCMEAGIAARLAANYWLNGHNDWYLPSSEELKKMSLAIGLASTLLPNLGGFATGAYYWSSTEDSSTIARGLYGADSIFSTIEKNYSVNPTLVRAVRTF